MSRRELLLGALLCFSIGLAAAAYLHWPALTDPLTYKSDVRQSPHWAAYHGDSFRDDDLLVLYGSFNESPVQNLIYWVGTFFVDYVRLTKIIAVVGNGLGAALFFWLGAQMMGWRAGVLAAIFVTFFPDQFEYYAGGFSKMWMIPLLLVAVFLIEKRSWRGLWWLIPFAALAYPVSAVLIGGVALTAVALEIPRHRDKGRAFSELRDVAVGGVLGILPLVYKYLATPPEVGPMASTAELLASPAMYKGGLSYYLPTPPIWEAFADLCYHPFIVGAAVVFAVVLRTKLGWRRSWTALLVASVICYVLADLLFMRLYFPNRYIRYSMGVLLPLWHAHNLDLLLTRVPWRNVRILILVAAFAAGGFLFRDTFEMGKDTIDRESRAPLSRFLATLPKDILVAGHPWDLDDIPVQARRSVLTNYKMNHVWFTTYRDEMDRRTRDCFRALYARKVEDVNHLAEAYGVTHLVVTEKYFESSRIRRKRVFLEPYRDFIYELSRGRRGFLLENPRSHRIIWSEEGRFLIELPLPETPRRGAP